MPNRDEPSLSNADSDTARRRYLEVLYGFLGNEQVAALQKVAVWNVPPNLTTTGQSKAEIEVKPLEPDSADQCAVCQLTYRAVLRRLGTAQRSESVGCSRASNRRRR